MFIRWPHKCICKLSVKNFSQRKGTILLDLEDYLFSKDSSIRVWHTPLGDKNSLRNLRGIKIKS